MSIIQIPSQSVLKLGLHQSSNNALHWEKRQLTPLCAPERSKTQLNTPLGYITLISCRLARFGVVQVHFEVISRPILTQNFPFWLLWCSVGSQNLKVPEIFCQIFITNMIVKKKTWTSYSLVRLVRPNTEELISRPLVGLSKIRLLFQDGTRSPEFRN